MKILIMDLASRTNKVGGEARVVAQLFKGLKKNLRTYYLGYETSYINAQGPNKIILKKTAPVGTETRKLKISELRIMRLAYNLVFVRRMKWFGVSKGENEAISKIAPDVIISNSLADFPLLNYLKGQGLKFKSIYVDHGSISTVDTAGYFSKESIPLTVGTGLAGSSVEEIKRKFFSFFDLCVALNKVQLSAMREFTPNVAYIPNSLGLAVKKNEPEKAKFKKMHNLSEDNFVVLYLGRMFERQKRISTLIEAFKKVKHREMRLLLVGSGPSLSDYLTLATDDHRIIFAGNLPEERLNSAYEVSDVFVLPSMWEGFSLVILEAAANSLPLILSKNAYTDDLKIRGIGPIPSFKPGDSDELAHLIEKMYGDKKFREKTIAASVAITKEFTEKKMLKRYKDAIDSIA